MEWRGGRRGAAVVKVNRNARDGSSVLVPGSTRRSVRHLEGHDTFLNGDTG